MVPFTAITCTAKLNGPDASGIPEMLPNGLTSTPVGKAPDDKDHTYGAGPAFAANGALYKTPNFASGRDAVVTLTFGCACVHPFDAPANHRAARTTDFISAPPARTSHVPLLSLHRGSRVAGRPGPSNGIPNFPSTR